MTIEKIEKTILEAKVYQNNANELSVNIHTNGNIAELIEATMKTISGIHSAINKANPSVAKDFRNFFMDEEVTDVVFTIGKENQEKKMAEIVNKRKQETAKMLRELVEDMLEDMLEDED